MVVQKLYYTNSVSKINYKICTFLPKFQTLGLMCKVIPATQSNQILTEMLLDQFAQFSKKF